MDSNARRDVMFEKIFESILWNSRLFTILAVIFSIFASIVLFFLATLDIWHVLVKVYYVIFTPMLMAKLNEYAVSKIIGAVDLYLVGVVLLIFAFGLYELFISKIDPATDDNNSSKVLDIHSLDQLKDKIAKVIIMVLIINFFQRVLHIQYLGALQMLYFAGSIFLLALALYFLHKGNH